MDFFRDKGKGVALCLLMALPAWRLGQRLPLVGAPVFAIVMGMLIRFAIRENTAFHPGIQFTSKKILQWAVILLGFGMNLSEILSKGRQSLPIILMTVLTALIVACLLCRLLRIPGKIATLIGVGSAICGGSAIAATAPVIGADDEEIAQSIAVIFFFNVVAALIFPMLGSLMGLSHEGFGLFAGTAINDTSSVTAAATAWDGLYGSDTLRDATIVKLTRTLGIIPITLGLGWWHGRKDRKNGIVFSGKFVPGFLLLFLLASALTTFLPLPAEFLRSLRLLSRWFIVMAMAGIGLNTDMAKLLRTGGKPLMMGFGCWLSISFVSLFIQRFLGYW